MIEYENKMYVGVCGGEMILKISNGYSSDIHGLGKIQSFEKLSQKRITKAVREVLRMRYGFDNPSSP